MRPRLSFANVTSALALFFALGGSAYAISVGGNDVVNNSLTGADVRKNSLKSGDIRGLGANVTVRTGAHVSNAATAVSRAACEQNETLISGGYGLGSESGGEPLVIFNFPTGATPGEWLVAAINTKPGVGSINVLPYALCAS
jgi:hypothetical protein